jgi:hypothetical protein
LLVACTLLSGSKTTCVKHSLFPWGSQDSKLMCSVPNIVKISWSFVPI